MTVAMLVRFKALERDSHYIPVATQGVYHADWQPTAEKLGLKWVTRFEDGPTIQGAEMAEVMEELRQLRAIWAVDPRNDQLLERIDFILEQLNVLDWDEVSEIFIG